MKSKWRKPLRRRRKNSVKREIALLNSERKNSRSMRTNRHRRNARDSYRSAP